MKLSRYGGTGHAPYQSRWLSGVVADPVRAGLRNRQLLEAAKRYAVILKTTVPNQPDQKILTLLSNL